jgi:hypothetical protein
MKESSCLDHQQKVVLLYFVKYNLSLKQGCGGAGQRSCFLINWWFQEHGLTDHLLSVLKLQRYPRAFNLRKEDHVEIWYLKFIATGYFTVNPTLHIFVEQDARMQGLLIRNVYKSLVCRQKIDEWISRAGTVKGNEFRGDEGWTHIQVDCGMIM